MLGESVGQAKLESMSKGRNWPLTKDTFQHFAGRSCHRGAREHVMLVGEVGSASEHEPAVKARYFLLQKPPPHGIS